MSTLCKFILRLASASAIALVPAGAFADPPGMLIDVPPHRHFVATPNGNVAQVGPDVCDPDLDLQDAFNQFHYNVHRSADNPVTPRATLGPQDGAPGLHDGQGADLAVMGGCG